MNILETLLQWLPPTLIGGASTYILLKKFPLEQHAQAADTESKVLDNYNRLSDRLTLYEERMAALRAQLNQQSDTIEKQADELKELNKASVRHSNDLALAHQDTADYKAKYEETKVGLDECRVSCQAQARAIRNLEAVLTKHHLLTPEIEADIEATLTPPADPPPPP